MVSLNVDGGGIGVQDLVLDVERGAVQQPGEVLSTRKFYCGQTLKKG